jgi:hypothetical protein
MAKNTVSAWDTAVELDGLELVDKSELVGKPFVITAFMFRTNEERGIHFVDLDIEFRDGETATFTDSSSRSGVKVQFTEYLAVNNIEFTEGEVIELPTPIMCARGLRPSTYPRTDPRTGKEKMVTSYYLTASGRRSR